MSPSQSGSDEPAVLLFGSLARFLSQSDLSALRSTILASPKYAWAKDIISSLPAHYKTLVAGIPGLHDVISKSQIDNLSKWLTTDEYFLDTKQLSNSALAPIVVMEQLVQYSTFLNSQTTGLEKPIIKETAGFCIGTLSAFAVALTYRSTITDFVQNAGAAIRLAMLVGAVVDQQHLHDERGPSTTLSVAWKRASTHNDSKSLEDILGEFPDVSFTLLPIRSYGDLSFLFFPARQMV